MKECSFCGTPMEIGIAHGAQFAQDIKSSYQIHCQKFEGSPTAKQFCADMYDRLHQQLPLAEEELLGIAQGSGLPFESILRLNYWEELEALLHGSYAPACSSIAFKASDRGPLLGKTTDIEFEQRSDYVLQHICPCDGYSIVQLGKLGTVKSEIGMNSAGLCIGTSSSMPDDLDQEPGVERMSLVRYALQYCANIKEAVEYFSRFHFYRLGLNIVLLEKSGQCAVLEKSIGYQELRSSNTNYLYATNFYAHPNMNRVYDHNVWYFDNAFFRYANLQKIVDYQEVPNTFDSILSILSNHSPEGAICDHSNYGTLYASVLVPAERKLYVCDGHPCEADFREFSCF